MLFSSIPFLYYFLPVVLILYFAVPSKLKNLVLLLSSLFFYGWGEPRYVIIMGIAIVAGYVFGRLIEAFRGKGLSKVFFILSLLSSVAMLGYFKYVDFFITNLNAVTGLSIPLLKIALPIGISFYTFQLLSYLVDVYRGTVPAQKNIINFGAYIAMFPQLIAGPIVRYSDIAAQLEQRTHSFEKCAYGINRFMIGLSKKILLANLLGELCDIFRASPDKSVLFFWLYAISFTLHIYFDFSGYSDMAIGLGKIFGFDFIENFNYPYISKSITEFWRRWHMSLGSWFRDYVYIPLGGNRVSKPRWFFNILVVWMLTGFWHGASWNFILWGLLYAAFLVIEKLFLGKYLDKASFLRHIYVMLIVMFGFVLFNATDVKEAVTYLGAMFGAGSYPLISGEFVYYLRSFGFILLLSVIGSTPLPKMVVTKLHASEKPVVSGIMSVAELLFPLVLLLLVTSYLVDGSFNPFLYFRF
ncbi:MAG: MBOAT family protein [Lachnospiraceae bacterium]|nr:MBOAT family protein [Lachnospiraceae bacterium]